jgi:hypothetical protein
VIWDQIGHRSVRDINCWKLLCASVLWSYC